MKRLLFFAMSLTLFVAAVEYIGELDGTPLHTSILLASLAWVIGGVLLLLSGLFLRSGMKRSRVHW